MLIIAVTDTISVKFSTKNLLSSVLLLCYWCYLLKYISRLYSFIKISASYNANKHLSSILIPNPFRYSLLSSRTSFWMLWNWVCFFQIVWAQLSFSKVNMAVLYLNVFLNKYKIRLHLTNSHWAALKKWVIFLSD